MKSVLNLLVLGAMLGSAACSSSSNSRGPNGDLVTEKAFPISECPELAGSYVAGDMHMEITESREGDVYRVKLGEGASEMIIDGKIHNVSDSAKYQGTCKNKILVVNGVNGTQRSNLRLYFNDFGQLVQHYEGLVPHTYVWRKE